MTFDIAPKNCLSQYCFVIPCYNHSYKITTVLQKLEQYQLHCFIIDDGSDNDKATELALVCEHYHWVTLNRLDTNQGKGAAVMMGMKIAYSQGYTHAIQIDADGQHNCLDIAELINQSLNHPTALISGKPVYDDSVPKHRLIARYITHFWVWIETLSFNIKDSMCGFRVYPLESSINLINKSHIGKRMDFDTEIMVKLYWQGNDVIFVPTKVIYPEDGLSHFKACKDNVLISWMHTKLFFGMLPRALSLIKRHRTIKSSQQHWSQTDERKGLWGIKFILTLYHIMGRRIAKIVMFPVILYFWLTGTNERKASKQYLKLIKQHYQHVPNINIHKLTTFHHFYQFGESILDKLASWRGDITLDDLYYPNKNECLSVIEQQRGIILLGSHLGDLEMCRAIASLSHKITVNALVFTHNAVRFNKILSETNPKATINLIQVDSLGPDTAINLKEKLEQGEWIAIMADRTSINPYQRDNQEAVIWADFLGKPAPFPKGPFILSSVLVAPIYLIWGLKPNGRYQFYFEHFCDKLNLPRKERQQALQIAVQHYAKRLEHHCLISPLDWGNFYDFWQNIKPNSLNREESENDR